MEEFATKAYVDDRIGNAIGIFMEHFNDKFNIILERMEMREERSERFELETGQRFKDLENRLISFVLETQHHFREVSRQFEQVDKRFITIETTLKRIESRL